MMNMGNRMRKIVKDVLTYRNAMIAFLILMLIALSIPTPHVYKVCSKEYQKKYKELRFTVLTPEYDPIRVRIGDLLHEWGKDIGIAITNKPVDFSTLCDLVFDQLDFDMYIIGWGMCIMPWYYERYCSWQHYPGGWNAEGFENTTFDRLYNESLVTIDRVKRRKLIWKMQEILAEELPIVGLYMRDMVEAVRAETVGWISGVWGIDWFRSALRVHFVDKPEGGELRVPLMDDMRKENIIDFGGTDWDWYPLCLIYETLFIFNESYEPIPWLVKRWEVSPDGKVWTFEIHHNITWHDGKPMTAEDVKFTIEYIIENKAPWWYPNVKDIEKVEVVDKYTIRMYLKKVNVWFLRLLAEVPIVPKHLWENVPWNTTKPPMVGSGPFIWVRRVPGEYVELKKNPNYWRKGYPKVDRIIFPIITNPSAMLMALEKGEIHYMTWYVPPAAIRKVAANPDLRLFSTPAPTFYYLGFNLKRYPLSEKVVRRAIAMIIDHDKIVKELLMGWARPALWFCAPTYKYWWNPNASLPPHNVTLAAKLLDDAGFVDYDGDGVREVPLEYKPGLSVTLARTTIAPGETLEVTVKLLTEKGEPIANETVTVTIYDPLGRVLHEETGATSADGSYVVSYAVPEVAPEGSYTVKAKALGEEVAETFRVEKPRPFWEVYGGYVIGIIGIIIAIVAIAFARMRR
ncbi:MAG: hypothetical protein DRN15_02770 [Thermoprotei archaeon]|nr:MAG: hypothetical protein DRN15_02770 [Thermoprotei archaeon]RLF25359.1 MAG: hypothetical protein DRM97_02090 [Thermoprotei archaeon]